MAAIAGVVGVFFRFLIDHRQLGVGTSVFINKFRLGASGNPVQTYLAGILWHAYPSR